MQQSERISSQKKLGTGLIEINIIESCERRGYAPTQMLLNLEEKKPMCACTCMCTLESI